MSSLIPKEGFLGKVVHSSLQTGTRFPYKNLKPKEAQRSFSQHMIWVLINSLVCWFHFHAIFIGSTCFRGSVRAVMMRVHVLLFRLMSPLPYPTPPHPHCLSSCPPLFLLTKNNTPTHLPLSSLLVISFQRGILRGNDFLCNLGLFWGFPSFLFIQKLCWY